MSNLNPNANVFVPTFTHRKPTSMCPSEIEAKCEAVVEILNEAALLCDELHENQTQSGTSSLSSNKSNGNHNTIEYDDEEELLEMFEMQEECRLEMMKFYVQAQNPELFEEVYYGVNYSNESNNNINTSNNGRHNHHHHHHHHHHQSQQQRDQQNKINGLSNMMKDSLSFKECSNP